jgi:hypothetical protein
MTAQPHAINTNQPVAATTADVAAELQTLLNTPRPGDPFALRQFQDASQRLYERQRKAVAEAESAHTLAKAKLLDDFHGRLENLRHEAREAVRRLDADHEAKMQAGQRILAALDELREC